MRTTKSRYVTLPVRRSRGPTLEPNLGSGLTRKHLVAGLLLAGSGRETRDHPPVGPPPAGGTMRDRCKEDLAVDEGGDLGGPIFRRLGCLYGRGMSPRWGSLSLSGRSRDID
ncbi:hypothetical protein CHARACLAT_033301 [Characodon lateralis]|uniref:Uncharacterized protein n=1 Tax=Characodon lateralis TaxID=208331 RepID=A0ABU7D5Y8_9TELE|nr:hypothetical protein [Characodon lateralis]